MEGELLSGNDQPVRDMVRKLKQKFLVMKVDYLAEVGEKSWAGLWNEQTWGTDSSRRVESLIKA